MLRNYLTIALRNLVRRPGYTLLNVGGLAVGIGCCVLILVAVQHELSYDRFHPGADRLYRVVQDVSWGEGMAWDWSTPLLADLFTEEFPEVEAAARFHTVSVLVEAGAGPGRFQEEAFAFVDPGFFDLFAFPFVAGDAATALKEPQTVVLTASAAEKYFGDADPLGQTLRLDNRLSLEITGVVADLPSNSHLDFDFAASFATMPAWYQATAFDSWWWPKLTTYVRLKEGTAAFDKARLQALVARHREAHFAEAIVPRLQPVTDIHLYGNPGGNAIRFVYIFSIIAAFILLIACVNYMNLSTARSARRAREVGVRKVAGARRRQLVGQFLGESSLIVLVALGLGLMGAELLLPAFNALSGNNLSLDLTSPRLWGLMGGLWVGVSLLAGSYPAFFLSKFAPSAVLKGAGAPGVGGRRLRQGLVVAQFVITIILLAGTLIVYQQVDFMRSASLGFETEQVVAVPLREGHEQYQALKQELGQQPGVVSVSAANWYPGVGGGAIFATSLNGEDLDADPFIVFTDHDFFRTLGIKVTAGRAFSEELVSDAEQAFLLNETAVRQYGLDAPLGKRLSLFAAENGVVSFQKEGEVVGVVRDFHMTGLQTPIVPVALTLTRQPVYLGYVLVRLAPGDPRPALRALKAAWSSRFPHRPFEATFIDDRIETLYQQEVQFGQTVGALAGLAVLIACLGLFGLAAFTAEQRTKEIGVRKVLGASVPGLVALLSKEFVRLVLAATLVALPLAYLGMQRWLDDFAYRIDVGVGTFLLAGALVLLVALATVSYQAVRAARKDPVESLRYE